VTTELLLKHDRPGPRYTSYPTAPVWTADFGPADYAERLAAADLDHEAPLALYCHVPYCEQMCWFCGCSVVIAKGERKAREYVDLVEREVRTLARHLPRRRRLAQHHWGGGTPTFLPPHELRRLYAAISSCFPPLPDAEISVEVHPAVTTHDHLVALRESGFNRISMGVQDFTPEVQDAIHRHQPVEVTAALVADARRLGFSSVNIDLVYGLPRQTVAGFGASVATVIAMGADRVACYSYAHVPWLKKHQAVIAEAELPRGAAKFRLFQEAFERFTAAGYVPVGMDHFARAGDELAVAADAGTLHRNFMGYTTKASDDMLGLGVTAIGEVAGAFVQSERDIPAWRAAVLAGALPVHRGWRRTADDEVRRRIIMDLMCSFRVRFADHAGPAPFATRFAPELERLVEYAREGMVELSGDAIAVTPLGRIFVRNLCMVFDAYLERDPGRPVFSRTI
jgi:oxygen-independent coproporphyrinogen-3 oxidase